MMAVRYETEYMRVERAQYLVQGQADSPEKHVSSVKLSRHAPTQARHIISLISPFVFLHRTLAILASRSLVFSVLAQESPPGSLFRAVS